MVIDYLRFFQALQYIAKNGCTWRAFPKEFGNWNSIYSRFLYWSMRGIFDRIEEVLMQQAIDIKGIKALALDSTYVKVHPDGTGASKKGGQSIGRSRGGLTTKIHVIVADENTPIVRQLSPGSSADEPVGQELMAEVPKAMGKGKPLLMDKA